MPPPPGKTNQHEHSKHPPIDCHHRRIERDWQGRSRSTSCGRLESHRGARHEPANFPGQFVTADLGNPGDTAVLASRLAENGNVLGIVNNVGLVKHEHFDSVDFADFSTIMELNIRPALQLTQALLPAMRNARFGRIVNVSSLVTLGFPYRSSYAAAKSALESLTRTIAVEFAMDGITANAVAPGPTETELFRENNPRGGEGRSVIWPKSRWGDLQGQMRSRTRLFFSLATALDSSRAKRFL